MRQRRYHYSVNHRCAGFTILELLIVIAVFGVIALVLFSGFSAVVRGYRSVMEVTGGDQRALLMTLKLERELRNVVLYGEQGFSGDPSRCSFYVRASSGTESGTLRKITYRFEGNAIVCTREDIKMGGAQDSIVLRGVQEGSFNYAVGSPDVGYSWVGIFSPIKGLPRAIRVRIMFTNSDGRLPFERVCPIPAGGWEY